MVRDSDRDGEQEGTLKKETGVCVFGRLGFISKEMQMLMFGNCVRNVTEHYALSLDVHV